MTIPSRATTTTTTASIPLSFGPPRPEEYKVLGRIVQDAFEISGRAVFGQCSREDVLPFRVSLVRHKDSLRQLYDQGKIQTCHRVMVARNANTDQIVGLAIWAIEDDWSPQGIEQRQEEVKLAIPTDPLPKGTMIALWEKVWKTFDKMQTQHLKEIPRCHLEYLCVDANVQRSGAGTALLEIVRKDAGDRLIWLEAADTPPAVRFYTKLNFENLGGFTVGDLHYTAMKLESSKRS